MSQNYIPTKWIDDKTVGTASVMNNMENGIKDAHNRIDGVDSQIKDIEKKTVYYVTPEMFHQDGEHDDTGKIQRAINYARYKNLDVRFGCKEYITSSTINLYRGTRLIGTCSNMGTGTGTSIKNIITDMFVIVPESSETLIKIDNCYFHGIIFKGVKDGSLKFINNVGRTYLNWSSIKECGFRGFNKLFEDISFTGCYLHNLMFYDCNTLGTIRGSDNSFYHWMINSTETDVNRQDYLIVFKDLMLTQLEDIFTTGSVPFECGCKNLFYLERVKGCSFRGVTLDCCDYYSLYLTNSSGNNFCNCYIRSNARASDSEGCIYIGYNCVDNKFYNNYFSASYKSVEKNEMAVIYIIDATSNNTKIYNNHYDAEIGFSYNDLGTNSLFIDESSSNIFILKGETYKNNMLSQLCKTFTGLAVNFEKYPQTIPANSTLEISSLATVTLPRGGLYKVVFEELPDGVSVYDTVYDGGKVGIKLKNSTSSSITLNTLASYEIKYISLNN